MNTMTAQELLQQALDALEYHTAQTRPIHNTELAIDAIRAHLAKPQGEPSTRQYYYRNSTCKALTSNDPDCICWHDEGAGPYPKEPDNLRLNWRAKPFYLHPAHTEAEIEQIMEAAEYSENMDVFRESLRRILGVSQQEPAP